MAFKDGLGPMAHHPTSPEEHGTELPDTLITDPKTGEKIRYADLRSEFERLSQQAPRNPKAERAFLMSKIELVRTDPNLSEDEKKRTIADLERGLGRATEQ